MPAHRMNMRMIKDVLRLKFDGGFSHERIAASLGISKGVVTKYIGLAGAAGLDWASACDMDEGDLERRRAKVGLFSVLLPGHPTRVAVAPAQQ